MPTTQVQPYLFFGGRCEEALEFYRTALGAQVNTLLRYSDSPDPMSPGQLAPGFENKVMHTSFRIGGSILMASDSCEPGGGIERRRWPGNLPPGQDLLVTLLRHGPVQVWHELDGDGGGGLSIAPDANHTGKDPRPAKRRGPLHAKCYPHREHLHGAHQTGGRPAAGAGTDLVSGRAWQRLEGSWQRRSHRCGNSAIPRFPGRLGPARGRAGAVILPAITVSVCPDDTGTQPPPGRQGSQGRTMMPIRVARGIVSPSYRQIIMRSYDS